MPTTDTPRSEFISWAKKRAHDELKRSGPTGAFASLLSDFRKHPETEDLVTNPVTLASYQASKLEGTTEAIEQWIDGF